jgi:exodeoxyribonuclease V alpha subunit
MNSNMIETINDVPQQFAAFFPDSRLHFYAALALRRLSEGHICADLRQTEGGAGSLKGMPMIGSAGDREPFILHNERLYLERYFYYETQILKRLQAFMRSSKERFNSRRDILLSNAELIRGIFTDEEDLSGLPAAQQVNWRPQ